MKLRVSAIATMAFLACMFACPAGAQQKKVTLTYKAPVSVPGITITGYKVYRGTASGAEGTTAYGTIVGGSVLTFIDTAVTPGTSYFYTVTATGTCDPTVYDCSKFVGESGPSNEAATGQIPLPAAPAIGAPTAATAVVQ